MKRKSQRAFTITELVIVIAVIAILAAVLIPTFSSVVEKAKVGTDTANAKTFSTQLSVHMVDSDVTITESNAREYITSVLAVNLVPQSASYGYHYVYNMNTGMIELKKLDEVVDVKTVQLAKRMSTTRSADWDNTPETCFLKQGYVFLDTAGSELAEVVNAMHNVNTVDDLNNVIGKLPSIKAKSETVANYLKLYIDSVVFVGEGANFTTSTNPTNVLFADGVRNITSVVNTLRKNGEVSTHNASMERPLATLSEGSVVEVPSTVEKISNNALVFGGNATLHFSGTLSETASKLEFSFTNCNFTFGNDNTLYNLSDDGRKIVSTATQEEASGELTAMFPVADFKIKADGVESTTGFTILLDNAQPSYQLFATNFVNTDGGAFVSDESVTWSVQKDDQSDASITEDGVLTFTKPGKITVTATSKSNSSISRTYQVIVGGVSDIDIKWNYPNSATQITFPTGSNETELLQFKTTFGSATFTVNPIIQPSGFDGVNVDYSVEILKGADIVTIEKNDKTFTATFTGDGEVQLKISAGNLYPVEYFVNIYATKGVFGYNPSAQFYRFASSSQVVLSFVENVNLSGVTFDYKTYIGNAIAVFEGQQVQFSGEGQVKVLAKYGELEIDSFLVEVIPDAVNVSQSSDFSATQSMCLVGDITLSGDISTLTVAEGKTLYGNGYTIDARTANYSNCLIELQGTMDNVIVFGYEPKEVSLDGGSDVKSASTVKVTRSEAGIYNSYLEGGQYVVNVNAITQGQVSISNTAIVNGTIGLGVTDTGRFQLNLTDITLAQFERDGYIGLGFGFYGGGAEKVTVNFHGYNNQLLNFMTESNVQAMVDVLSGEYSFLLGILEAFGDKDIAGEIWALDQFRFKTEDSEYFHLGVLTRAVSELDDSDYPNINTTGSNLEGKMMQGATGATSIKLVAAVQSFNSKTAQGGTAISNNEANEQIETWKLYNSYWTNGSLSAEVHSFAYQPLQPTVTFSKQLRVEVEQDGTVGADVIKNNFSAAKYGQNAEYTTDESATKPLYYLVEVKKYGVVVEDWTTLPVGSYSITYKLIDKLGAKQTYEYTASLVVDTHKSDLSITATDKTVTAEKYETMSISKNIGFITYEKYHYKAIYNVTLADIGLVVKDGDSVVSDYSNYTFNVNGVEYGYNDTINFGEEMRPGGSDDRNARTAKTVVFTLEVCDQYNRSATTEVTVTFKVEKIGGIFSVNYWG